MKTVLFFHTSQRQAWQKELAGVYRFARIRKWRIQIIEPTPRPPSISTLIDFWNPLGCLVECSGKAADYFDPAAFGNLPVVYLGRDPRTLPRNASFVNPSKNGPGRCAAQELLTAGFTSFGFVASSENHFWSRDREAEFKRDLWTNGYRCCVFGRTERFKTTRARSTALSKWIKELPKPCGVLAENDYVAGEVLDLANKLHLNVPKAFSVVGTDNDSSLCENTTPPLSSILLDFEHAGYRAAEILAMRIDQPKSPPIHETYSALGLVRRGTTPAGIGTPVHISKALVLIREKACSGITATDIAKEMPGSLRLSEMTFKKATGHSILEEILRVRFERVELLLRSRSQKVGTLANLCGWRTENALRTAFLKRYGKSMRAWREDPTPPLLKKPRTERP